VPLECQRILWYRLKANFTETGTGTDIFQDPPDSMDPVAGSLPVRRHEIVAELFCRRYGWRFAVSDEPGHAGLPGCGVF